MTEMKIHNGVWRKPADIERLNKARKDAAIARAAETKAEENELQARILAAVEEAVEKKLAGNAGDDETEPEKPAAKTAAKK